MQTTNGKDGRNVFPVIPLDQYTQAGTWVEFTDGTKRRVSKVESTIGFGAQGDRYMVVLTILFDDDESMWIKPKGAYDA